MPDGPDAPVSHAAPVSYAAPAVPAARAGPLAWAAAIALVPVSVLAGLAINGHCPVAVAAGASLLTLASARFAVSRWNADLAVLAETARRAGWSDAAAVAWPRPALAGSQAVASEVARLAAKLSERAALIEQLLGAEETIVERLPDPLLLLGADRAVRRANEAARDVFGGSLAAVLRQPSLRAAIDAALAPGASPDGGAPAGINRVELAFAAPLPRDVLATVIGIHPPLSGGGRVLVVLSDRTRERAVERTRADFVANASHELRTPLASLIGFIDTLRGPAADDPPAQARFLAIMGEQAARMNRLIDDLLSLSRIEVSEHVPPQALLDLSSLIGRVADGFAPRLSTRRQTLALALAPGLPPVAADEDQLVQVLGNLLDNAVKYGREGGRIVLTLRAEAGRPETGFPPAREGVAFTVADDGQGIAAVHLPRLTERFYRAGSMGGKAPPGTGLGLAIVKHIVNRHRGTLRIDSEEGRGSRFTVWLPSGAPDGARVRRRAGSSA